MLFLVVKTSLGIGRVVATIILHYERTEMINQGHQVRNDKHRTIHTN